MTITDYGQPASRPGLPSAGDFSEFRQATQTKRLRVDPERRFFLTLLKAWLSAAEWVKDFMAIDAFYFQCFFPGAVTFQNLNLGWSNSQSLGQKLPEGIVRLSFDGWSHDFHFNSIAVRSRDLIS